MTFIDITVRPISCYVSIVKVNLVSLIYVISGEYRIPLVDIFIHRDIRDIPEFISCQEGWVYLQLNITDSVYTSRTILVRDISPGCFLGTCK